MKSLLTAALIGALFITSSPSVALTDIYYATGEDLDYLIESDHMLAIREIEFELRKFVLFRDIQDYIFELSDQFDFPDD